MKFIRHLFEKLQQYPKRIIFPEGTEPAILMAASEYVQCKLGVAIVLGDKAQIEKVAADKGIPLNRIHIIDPSKGDDLQLFMKKLESMPRYKGINEADALKIVTHPNYFASMMLHGGQVDGLVGGYTSASGSILRPLFQIIKPLPGVKTISSCMILQVPACELGDNGLFYFADCGVIPNPTVEQLANIAVETAKLNRQLTGEAPRVAMLSYSTKGSAKTQDTEKIAAATSLARQYFIDHDLDVEIDGELQVDAALVKEVAEIKAKESPVAGRANVLIFPDLNSGNIAMKLVHRLTNAKAFGQILLGLDRPAADLSRGASVDEIVGIAAIIGMRAVHYRQLYPEQGARYLKA
ncbi:phosphate acetyltransferase [Verrucomicrobia bacterium LW23]|nr:phosphate acetyltransferase [Verrucomicrobia bacterium LW23]